MLDQLEVRGLVGGKEDVNSLRARLALAFGLNPKESPIPPYCDDLRAMFVGKETFAQTGMGPATIVSPEAAKRFADAMENISEQMIRQRYSASLLNSSGLIGWHGCKDNEDDINYVLVNFRSLKVFCDMIRRHSSSGFISFLW